MHYPKGMLKFRIATSTEMLKFTLVPRRDINAQRIHNLVTYLQELHSLGLANSDHPPLGHVEAKRHLLTRQLHSQWNSIDSNQLPFIYPN